MKKNRIAKASKNQAVAGLTLIEIAESNEFEIQKQTACGTSAKRIRFPKDKFKHFQSAPKLFKRTLKAIAEYKAQMREQTVYADSIESHVGYESLVRLLGHFYGKQVAYYHSAAGGNLSLEEARAKAYQQNLSDEEAKEHFDRLMAISTDFISFGDLLKMHGYSPAVAENIWELIKCEARDEFESGHRAASVFEPADYLRDAKTWTRHRRFNT